MPSYLDFNSTKKLRDDLLKRTLDPVYGQSPSPKTFTTSNYSVQKLSDSPNLLQPQVDANRKNDLLTPQKFNIFKPTEYFIKDTINDLPRRANLSLYPYFTPTLDSNLIGIINASDFNTESELFKFAANNIKTNPQGPLFSRIQQNIDETKNAVNNMSNMINGNSGLDLYNIISGIQPLKSGTDKITVNSNVDIQPIDFIGTVEGTSLPFNLIPGNYLTNPMRPINVRPTDVSATTKVWQDLTGILGSIVGIQRRPLPTRKPSDLLIENMGESSKYRLFDLLRFSKYAPNYTLTAMSQQSSLLFNIPGMIAQGISDVLGDGAPIGVAYIGDDRSNDVKNSTNDIFSGRPVRSSYYLSLMFDPIATKLFHQIKPITEGGNINGNLTWMSSNQTIKLDQKYIDTSNSSYKSFRPDSILDVTQQILNSKPQTGGDSLSHIGNIIDQTSKYFKDGDTLISRGSGVMYLDNSGKDIGVQYARVWTKDRPYLTNADTMPLYKETTSKPYYSGSTGTQFRRTGIRRFDGSVMTNTWNLNMAPMSDGAKGFGTSSNIGKSPNGKDFYAKKYMLSIENLAWKTSTVPGFTVNDLPFSERGPNGGRVMWFPPYDLKVSEQNSAKWESNTFLGRPEPIYTYQNTERTGQLSFKVVVDHPSILNLLIREHFKSTSEEEVEKFFNSFFAGAKDIDFYSLIRTYANLDSDDIQLIQQYLNSNGDPSTVKQYKTAVSTQVQNNPGGTTSQDSNSVKVTSEVNLNFNNNSPSIGINNYDSLNSYDVIKTEIALNKTVSINGLTSALNSIITGNTVNDSNDRKTMFGKDDIKSSESGTTINKVINDLNGIFDSLDTSFTSLTTSLSTLKEDLKNKNVSKNVVIQIGSSTTKIGDDLNYTLAMRRSNAVYQYIISQITNNITPKEKWSFSNVQSNISTAPGQEKFTIEVSYTFKELGYEGDGQVTIRTTNYGYNANTENGNCGDVQFFNKNLTLYSTLSYGCRKSKVNIEYKKTPQIDQPINASNNILSPTGAVVTKNNKPSIDVMKRIIMKTLSEEYYFKKLEETSPVAFGSLKEKLKYFHPGFHSMTPEGLNSRLTFLQQCLRPGNTIPVKGLSDNSDIDSRNTSFGPPPICILRVGDFYNSKIVIKDLNIQFEENTWDLNPEGIGVQPMIADVTLQINFIGGQGLERPVERLQNALSSNFYANTEMYDERSEETTTSIGGQTGNTFTKSFLEKLNSDYNIQQTGLKDANGKGLVEGKYIGTSNVINGDLKSIDYTDLVSKVYSSTADYFNQYQTTYNSVLTTYGSLITNVIFNQNYRGITKYKLYNGMTGEDMFLFGVYPNNSSLSILVDNFSNHLLYYLNARYDLIGYTYILEAFKLTDIVNPDDQELVCNTLHNYIINNIPTILSDLNNLPNITKYESTRNSLISSLDGLNFINKNGYDVKIVQGKTYKATYSGYTEGDLYKQYQQCTDYILNNTTNMYSKLNTTIDFTFSTQQFQDASNNNIDPNVQDILQTLFYNYKTQMIGELGKNLTSDKYSILDPIQKQLDKVLYQETPIVFKFPKLPILKNNNIVNYAISSEQVDNTTEEIKKLFGSQNLVTNINDLLNYYKP